MISLKDKKSKQNLTETLEKYNEYIDKTQFTCSICNSDNYEKWGTYNRNVIYIADGKLKKKIIKIQRIRCKECGHTHAIIPCDIVPYKINTLNVILENVLDGKLALESDVSYETVIKWQKDFMKFLPYIKTIFSEIKNLKEYLLANILETYEKFYIKTKKILMMTHKGIYNMAYF